MTDDEAVSAPLTVAAVARRRRRQRRTLRVIGSALLVYGVIGLILLGVFGSVLAAPISDIDEISRSVEQQRVAALDSLEQATETVNLTADAVRGMDTSLTDARAATDRASTIALGVSTSMSQLANSMSITIFGIQPLVGLAEGFNQSSTQLSLLATDLASIGAALESNRDDAAAVAVNLDGLGVALDRLETAVRAGPDLTGAAGSLEAVRVGILGLIVWLGVLAVGCVVAGLGCWWVARSN